MKFIDTIMLSTRTFATRPMRTFLTILGVSVGIGTVLFLVSLGYGLQNVILNKITTADALLSLDVSSGEGDSAGLDKENVNKILQIKEVREVSPVISLSSQMRLGDLTGDATVYGVDASYFRLSGIDAAYGQVFNKDEDSDAVISSAGAKLFNQDPAQIIGKEIFLDIFLIGKNESGKEEVKQFKEKAKYVVKGLVEDDNTSFVYVPKQTVSDSSIAEYSQLKVKVDNESSLEPTRSRISGMGFVVSSLSDTIDQAKRIFRIVQIILSLFGLVALSVSAIGMFNTMTVTLLERINEIGIMRSIGASSSDIRKLFLVESVLMGFLGGVGGIILGYLAASFVNLIINILAKSFGGQAADLFYLPGWFVLVIIVFSTFIGFATGIYPSRRASKLNPLEALRYK